MTDAEKKKAMQNGIDNQKNKIAILSAKYASAKAALELEQVKLEQNERKLEQMK